MTTMDAQRQQCDEFMTRELRKLGRRALTGVIVLFLLVVTINVLEWAGVIL